ncbi:DNA-binding domain-containing protein [Sphingomonas sp. RB56-2]|uniref:DNA-binding domain-containing protein n=1 Tax=Sphingomonas brevis TaxID=2908206 RepID=A0ABT0SAP1_9SPHN|nr:DNA-binding domain-containing protein [Sphingomonas brevis]MCL6741437.1 DNA-binding domain-containing protein [Sphingomonas brevis]
MRLRDLQREFSECLRDGRARHKLPIVGDGLRVYRNNYREQLRSALRTGFPYLALWLGDSEFERAADAHIALQFPASWTLDHYGYDFSATVQALFPQDPEVPELAWLDWAMAEALVAEDEAPIDTGHLTQLNWDDARIIFVSSLRTSEARSNAADIWLAIDEQSPPPPAAILSESHAYIVWRRGLLPCFRSVPIWEFQVVSALKDGSSFADACEILRLRFGTEGAIGSASDMLARWLSDELITRVESGVLGEV